jgi:hypothetical protein
MSARGKRLAERIAGGVLAVVGVTVGLTSSAEAADGETWTRANTNAACHQQYGGGVFGVSHYFYSPDGLYCYGLSTDGLSWIGTLDKHRMYSYCRAVYGKRADARVGPGWRLPQNSWWCVTPS